MRLHAESYASLRSFLDRCDCLEPGCILLDIRAGAPESEFGGVELLRLLEQENFHQPVIFTAANGDVPLAVRAVKAGAMDFLEKPCREPGLLEAIQGALVFDRKHRRQQARRAKVRKRLAQLTAGERDVLKELLDGHSHQVIAEKLGVSVRAVEVRRAKLMRKMQAESLVQLVRLALEVRDEG